MVITGQQKGLKGTVKEIVDQDTIRVEFTSTNQTTSSTVDVPNMYVKVSDYEIGDSVEVIQGDKLGVKGLVVEVTEGCVVIHNGKSKETVRPGIQVEPPTNPKKISSPSWLGKSNIVDQTNGSPQTPNKEERELTRVQDA